MATKVPGMMPEAALARGIGIPGASVAAGRVEFPIVAFALGPGDATKVNFGTAEVTIVVGTGAASLGAVIAGPATLGTAVAGAASLGAVIAGPVTLGAAVAGAASLAAGAISLAAGAAISLAAGALGALISETAALGVAAVVCAGTLVATPWLGIGVVATASTSPVGYTRVASVAVTIKVTWGIAMVVVTIEVVRVTTTPDETPVVMVVGSQGTTVVIVRMIVWTGTLADGASRVIVAGMAVTIAGLEGI